MEAHICSGNGGKVSTLARTHFEAADIMQALGAECNLIEQRVHLSDS